jgi:hypothetical protein
MASDNFAIICQNILSRSAWLDNFQFRGRVVQICWWAVAQFLLQKAKTTAHLQALGTLAANPLLLRFGELLVICPK